MRTLIDIDETELRALDRLAKSAKVSRASLIRKALDEYLLRQRSADEAEAFGLWGRGAVDGVEYQDKVRGEW